MRQNQLESRSKHTSCYHELQEHIETLQEEKERYEKIFKNSRDGFVIVDSIGRFMNANQAYCQMLGYTLDELRQKTDFYEITPLRWREWERAEIWEKRLLREGYSGIYEKEYIRKDGTVFPVELQSYTVFDDRGHPRYLWGIARDITARKQAEKEIRNFKNALDSSSDAIGMSTPEGRHFYQNKTFDRIFGEIGDDPPASLYVNQDIGREVFETIMNGDEWSGEVTMYGKDKKILNILLRAYSVKEDEKVVALVGVHTDITERKRAEEEIRLLNEELEQRVIRRTTQLEMVNQELQEFAYVVSHDLKSPLRAVSQLASWLRTDYGDLLDDTGNDYLKLIEGRVKRMDLFINGILEYSRVGRIHDHQEDISLPDLVDEVIHSLTPAPQIRIVREHALPVIYGSRIRIMQVFQNLLSNAIKYLETPQGVITITCEEQERTWLFGIRDNGPGIEPQHYERIFKIFQTLHPRDDVESTGIGLTLVKKIVELHGGTIWVESERGKGSTFYFTLPKK